MVSILYSMITILFVEIVEFNEAFLFVPSIKKQDGF
jgi:hypothetical protein